MTIGKPSCRDQQKGTSNEKMGKRRIVKKRGLVYRALAAFILYVQVGYASDPQLIQNNETAYLAVDQDLQAWGVESCDFESSYMISSGTYETLVNWDGSNFVPRIAKSWTQVDEKTFIFTLAEKTFSNLEPVTPLHIKQSLESLKSKTKFCSLMLETIGSIDVKSDRAVQINFNRVDPLALRRIAFWLRIFSNQNSVVDPSIDLANAPVGTGPLKLISVKKGEVTFQRWLSPNKPTVHLKTGEPPSLQQLKENRNRVRFISDVPDHLKLFAARSLNLKIVTESVPSSTRGVFNLRKSSSPFLNSNLRKAVNLAIDRDEINRLVFNGSAIILPSFGLIGEIGAARNLPQPKFDRREAKVLIDQYLKKTGTKKLDLLVGMQGPTPTDKAIVSIIAKHLSSVKINLSILGEYNLSNHQKFINLVDLVWGSDPSPYAHFDFFVRNFYHSESPFFLVDDPEIALIQKKVSLTGDAESADRLFENIDKISHEKYLGVFGFQGMRSTGLDPDSKIKSFGFFDLGKIYE